MLKYFSKRFPRHVSLKSNFLLNKIEARDFSKDILCKRVFPNVEPSNKSIYNISIELLFHLTRECI